MTSKFEQESSQYDLSSLVKLQKKRRENILLFEQSIKKEREASSQEEMVESTLENKIKLHNKGIIRLSDANYQLILLDLPKLRSTRERRNKTIALLKNAIIEEQTTMDREERMIAFLESNDSQK